jgi:hypothetical protein
VRQKQNELITGKLLGDGSLENRGTANSRLQIRHSIHQKHYVDWCWQQLREFTCSLPKRHENSYYFRTKSLPVFTKLRKVWYPEGRKILPSSLKINPFILAVWYMDDGYYDRRRDSVWLCTHCFKEREIKFLQRQLLDLGIESGIVKDRSHQKIRVFSKDKDRFISLVRRYITPSLLYKIGIAP